MSHKYDTVSRAEDELPSQSPAPENISLTDPDRQTKRSSSVAAILDADGLRAVLDAMTDEDRNRWVEDLDRAAANIRNATYALTGNLPDAQPDPTSWALPWLALGLRQVQLVTERINISTGVDS